MPRTLHTLKQPTACPYCAGNRITKKGTRKNKYGAVQLYFCRHCQKKFTAAVTKHKSFPLKVILDALSLYNRLFTKAKAARAVSKKYGITVHPQNITHWIDGFSDHLPFLRMRPLVAEHYDPRKVFVESQLFHGQVYGYKYHRAKTDLLLTEDPKHARFRPLQKFLEHVPRDCPHERFRENYARKIGRASQHKNLFNLDEVVITPKTNAAIENARVLLQAVANNKLRHETLQEFMLINDSVTVAVEVPIILTPEDIAHYRDKLGFHVPLDIPRDQTITGHIDIIQVRNGHIHILDYKPNAKKTKPIEQLMIYALALSRLTGLRLYHFKCAWFDDEHYFEFYPLHVVHKKRPS